MANVLLIEDDEAQRFVAAFALKKAGHQVREAPDGPQGVAAARAEPPEVIVCDVMMPGMTGYEVVAELRADVELATVPIILLTAMSDRKHMRQGMTAGADDYLTKPYRPDELREAIETVLSRRQVQQEAFRSSVHLQREINGRWTQADKSSDLHYEHAYLLLADLLGNAPGDSDGGLAERVKQAQRQARDTLYLFGATQVLPYGPKLMAVFDGNGATKTTPAKMRVLRAAIALAKTAPRDRTISVALHQGAVALVAVNDALHGDQGHALVPGESVTTVLALEEFGAANGWRITGSAAMVKALDEQASVGRRGDSARGEPAIEITGLAPT
jgi:CheY-like chemotaxis protein